MTKLCNTNSRLLICTEHVGRHLLILLPLLFLCVVNPVYMLLKLKYSCSWVIIF
jgi:hypothetical protein